MEQSAPGGSTGPDNRLDCFGLLKFLTIKTNQLFCLGPVLPPTTLIDEAASSSNATTTLAVATATAAAQLIGLRRGRNQKLI